MFNVGWLRVGTIYGAPVRLHFTLPIGAFFFVGTNPGAMLAFVLIILIHEAGHAALVVRAGARVDRIDIHGLGGLCAYRGFIVPYQRATIAWGGVLAQGAAFVVAWVWIELHGSPETPTAFAFLYAFLGPNLRLAAFNLIPIPPFDGAEAWPLLGMIWRRFRSDRAHESAKKAAQRPAKLRTVDRSEKDDDEPNVRDDVAPPPHERPPLRVVRDPSEANPDPKVENLDRDDDSLDEDEEAARKKEADVQRILVGVLDAKSDAPRRPKPDPSPARAKPGAEETGD